MCAECNKNQPLCDFCGQPISVYETEHGKYEQLNELYFHLGLCSLNGKARESKIGLRGC